MTMYFKIKKTNSEQRWGRSCFFGCPDLPRKYLSKVSDEEIFIAQINLLELREYNNSYLLPKQGILYFFYDIEKNIPIIRYNDQNKYNEKEFARVDFNEIIDFPYDITQEYLIFPQNDISKNGMLIEDEKLRPGEIVLLRVSVQNLHYENDDVSYDFIVNKEDLLNRDYSKVRIEANH